MRGSVRPGLAGAGLAALCACSGGSPAAAPPPVHAAALAARLGCTGFTPQPPQALVAEWGTCSLGPDSVSIYTFATNSARDLWLQADRTAEPGRRDVGDRFVARGVLGDTADTIAAAIGGTAG